MAEQVGVREIPSLLRDHEAVLDTHRERFRDNLKTCLLVARAYDGTEATYRSLFETLEAFEAWQLDTFGSLFSDTSSHRLSESQEEALLAYYHPHAIATIRSIGQLLRLAVKRCSRRFMKELDLFLAVHAQFVDGVLIPPGTGQKVEAGEEAEPFTKKDLFTPRLRLILGALQERGVFLEDVVLWVGLLPSKSMRRQKSYVVIEIPRLRGRQILVCDQVKEGTFVLLEPLDPRMLVNETKGGLQERYPETVRPVKWVDEETWKAEIIHLAFLEIAPGEKIDIALREDLRRQIRAKYSIQDFIDEKGKAKFNFTGQSDRSPFIVAGRRFKALATAFGFDQVERDGLAGLRFLAAVYGATDPWLEPHLMRLERQTELQKTLATDPVRWRGYLRGDPIEIRVQGRVYFESPARPLKNHEDILKLTAEGIHHSHYAGKSIESIAGIFLSQEELEEVAEKPLPSELLIALFARGVYGDTESLSQHINRLRRRAAIHAELGTSPDRWRSFVKGESLQVTVRGERVTVLFSIPVPTIEAFRRIPLRKLRTMQDTTTNLSFGVLARDVFTQTEPALLDALQAQDALYFKALFSRALYGATPDLDREIQVLATERVTRRMIEKNPALLGAVIRGEPLPISLHGRSVAYQADTFFPRADEFIAQDARSRKDVSFGGVTLQADETIRAFMGGDIPVDFDPGNDQADFERFALNVYGNVQLATGEFLADRVLKNEQVRALINQSGSRVEQWRSFLLGERAIIEIDKRRVEIFAEQPVASREDFVKMTTQQARAFRIAGMGLTKFATILGLAPQTFNVFSQNGLHRIADVLFASE